MENVINNTRAIILAAGKSTRFNTEKTKLLYSICGQPMILYPVKMLKDLGISITMVVGHCADHIKEEITKNGIDDVNYILQKDPQGTGHAIALTKDTWDKENILILNGDAPLLNKDLIQRLVSKHKKEKADFTFLSAHCLNPEGYGRVMEKDGKISVVEDKNCTREQSHTTLINAGIYLITKKYLQENIDKIERNEVTGEYYLTDLISLASKVGANLQTLPVPYDNVRGINTLEELWAAEQVKRSEIIKNLMRAGVRFELAQSIHIDFDIEVGAGSFIGTGVHLIKGTRIGKNCNVNAFSIVENTVIEDDSHIHSHSVIQDSKIGKNVHVGPFARLRNNTILGDNTNIGNFVEVKNSSLDENSKAKHLTYLGDAQLGKSVNVGGGTITCNYDGKNKHKTVIEEGAFVGSNNTLIAPIKIGKNSYTAGGSTLNKDVPKDSLAFGRAKQQTKEDYFGKKKAKKERMKKNDESKNMTLNFVGAKKTEDNLQNL